MYNDSMANLGAVILDVIIILECWSNALWLSVDLKNSLMLTLGIAFGLAALGFVIVGIGDVALALGFRQDDMWFLTRAGRAFPARIVWAIAFGLVTVTLRFGKWNR